MENKFKNKSFTNIKGFTLVELVIVIAVIAILAGVLIPTFSNIIEKANVSNDINLIRNINEVLVINSADKEVPQTKDEFRNVISEYGIKDFKNKSKNHIFYYIKEDNISVIWGIKEQRIIYPEYYNYNGSNIEDEINLSINDIVNKVLTAEELDTYSGEKYCYKYKDNTRLDNQGDRLEAASDYVATGAIKIKFEESKNLKIYIKGASLDKGSFCIMHIFKESDAKGNSITVESDLMIGNNIGEWGLKVTKILDNYFVIECYDYDKYKEKSSEEDVYYALSLNGSGENLIITHNEEIYDFK